MENSKALRSGCVVIGSLVMLFMCWLTTLLFVLPAIAMFRA